MLQGRDELADRVDELFRDADNAEAAGELLLAHRLREKARWLRFELNSKGE